MGYECEVDCRWSGVGEMVFGLIVQVFGCGV